MFGSRESIATIFPERRLPSELQLEEFLARVCRKSLVPGVDVGIQGSSTEADSLKGLGFKASYSSPLAAETRRSLSVSPEQHILLKEHGLQTELCQMFRCRPKHQYVGRRGDGRMNADAWPSSAIHKYSRVCVYIYIYTYIHITHIIDKHAYCFMASARGLCRSPAEPIDHWWFFPPWPLCVFCRWLRVEQVPGTMVCSTLLAAGLVARILACFWLPFAAAGVSLEQLDVRRSCLRKHGCGSKLKSQGYAGFSLWFHLPWCHFGTCF